MQTIGYFDAWRLWFGGQQPPQDAVLWGVMSLRWWARAGKIAAFIGGATVILDLIGPDRLRKIATRNPHRRLQRAAYLAACASAMCGTVWIVFARSYVEDPWYIDVGWAWVGLTLFLMGANDGFAINLTVRAVVDLLDRERPAESFRYIGLGLIFVGFHFDLLSS